MFVRNDKRVTVRKSTIGLSQAPPSRLLISRPANCPRPSKDGHRSGRARYFKEAAEGAANETTSPLQNTTTHRRNDDSRASRRRCMRERVAGRRSRQAVALTAASTPSTAPELNPSTIPRFQTPFQRFYTYAATRNGAGQNEYTVQINTFQEQQLPPGFPATPLFGYGGNVSSGTTRTASRCRRSSRPARSRSSAPRPGRSSSRCAVPGGDSLSKRAGRRAPRARRSDAGLGEPQQLPEADAAVPAVPARVPAGAVADRAHHAHPRHRGAPRIRRHARHLVHDEQHPRPGIRVERLHAAEQQPVGGVLVPRPRVRRDPPGRRFGLSGFSILRDPAGEPLDRHGNEDILGFEDPNDWTSTMPSIQPGVSTNHTPGKAVACRWRQGFVELRRPAVQSDRALPANITLDFFLPTQQANPSWFGAVQLYADCPSKGVNNAFLSQVELTGKPTSTFNTLTFSVPAATAAAWAARATTSTCASRSTSRPMRPAPTCSTTSAASRSRRPRCCPSTSSRFRSSSRIARSAPTAASSTRRPRISRRARWAPTRT